MLSLVLMLCACANEQSAEIQPLTELSPIAPAAAALPPYLVQVGDVLEIKFRQNPELDETLTVRPDGMISTGMFEDIAVYNHTVKEVNGSLKKLYARELTNPQISTIVRSFAPTRIYVGGEVVNPGEFIVIGPTLTLSQAIARAGGTLNSGDGSRVLILRNGAGAKGKVYYADYDGATQEGDPTKDVRLSPYDVVFVPKTGAALTYKGYQQYLQQFLSPPFSASYQINND